MFIEISRRKKKIKPKYKLGGLGRTAYVKKDFSKGDSTTWSFNFITVTEVVQDRIPSNRIKNLPERYNQSLLLSTKLSLDEKIEDMGELNLIQCYDKKQI